MTLLLLSALIACGPARVEPLENIETSETAFVVPLEDAATGDQQKVQSADYWKNAQVSTKRIVIPVRKRSTGRWWNEFEWIPTMRVVRVDRAPVTREWRSDGEDDSAEKIHVESKDSIGFSVGVDLTAEIYEEDAATYLYHFGAKPLSKVIDDNVRSYVVSFLSNEFGKRDLVDCKADKTVVSEALFTATSEHFKDKGITISNIGLTDGLTYEDAEIQAAINRTFQADQRIETAKKEKLAAEAEGQVALAKANADAEAAEAWAQAEDAQRTVIELEIERLHGEAELLRAQATLEMAEKWDGGMPDNILPADSPMLTTLGVTAGASSQ